MPLASKICVLGVPALLLGFLQANVSGQAVVPLGAGSYTTVQPPGTKAPPKMIYRTENFQGKMPTTQWWSSLSWSKFPNRQYPHPLAVTGEEGGLRIYYPGPRITVGAKSFNGQMPGKGDDLILGHSEQKKFGEALIDGYSDWFVNVRLGSAAKGMTVSYGHGSPYVFAVYEGGQPTVTFSKTPKIWSGDPKQPVLGVSVDGRNYGLFGPAGSTWSGLDGTTFTNKSGKKYFSVAVLPDDSEMTLDLFKKHAHAHVTKTTVDWKHDPQTSEVTTTFTYTTKVHEGEEPGTIFALYPHQWRNLKGTSTGTRLNMPLAKAGPEYSSVRGTMKLAYGDSFKTVMRYNGTLPSLPVTAGVDKKILAGYLKSEAAGKTRGFGDTYGDGKWLGRYAQLIPLAEQCGEVEIAKQLRDKVRIHLEGWFTAADKKKGLFYYDGNWGTLIGYPASYGSDTPCNDHHFHYGYFIKAAGEIARGNPAWAKDDQWGGMVKILIRDIANSDHGDKMFPYLRCFDPYAGHGWASGDARFADGNNQESSSESMNAWSGIILFAEAIGDKALRDLGIWMYTTEMNAINEYWFDVHGENFPKGFTRTALGIVWGGMGQYGTWWTADVQCIHGINWLPIHGGSLYLGNYPAYVEKNYAALAAASTNWKDWQDLVWMYRALSDPADAIKMYEAGKANNKAYFDGNGQANTYAWIYALNDLGQVDAGITADCPLYAVFRKGKTRTYVAYNMTDRPRTVAFSDGFRMNMDGKGFTTVKGKE